MATFTWNDRELPILEAINDGYENGELVSNADALAEIVGRPVDEVQRTLMALYEAGYVDGSPSRAIGGATMFDLHVMRPTERARREIGQWPTENPYDNLVALLEQRIADTTDPDQRSRLVKLRDSLLSVGRDIGTSLLTALARDQLGLG